MKKQNTVVETKDAMLQRRFEEAEPLLIEILEVKADPQYQPRSRGVLSWKERDKVRRRESDHVKTLANPLLAARNYQLEPIWLAKIDGGHELLVIDGHHRLSAYKRAKRAHIPARVISMSQQDAVLVSKTVNQGTAMLPMAESQSREQCWQYTGLVTRRGKLTLEEAGLSYRQVAAKFGTSHETVRKMEKKLQTLKLKDFSEDALDPATGLPKWKHLRSDNHWEAWDPKDRHQKQLSTCYANVNKAIRNQPNEVVREVLYTLLEEMTAEDWSPENGANFNDGMDTPDF